jgi:hypothetical protein
MRLIATLVTLGVLTAAQAVRAEPIGYRFDFTITGLTHASDTTRDPVFAETLALGSYGSFDLIYDSGRGVPGGLVGANNVVGFRISTPVYDRAFGPALSGFVIGVDSAARTSAFDPSSFGGYADIVGPRDLGTDNRLRATHFNFSTTFSEAVTNDFSRQPTALPVDHFVSGRFGLFACVDVLSPCGSAWQRLEGSVSSVRPVPEPSTALLLIIGIAGAGIRLRHAKPKSGSGNLQGH